MRGFTVFALMPSSYCMKYLLLVFWHRMLWMDHGGVFSCHLLLFLAISPSCFPFLTFNLVIIQSNIFNLCLPLVLFSAISASINFLSFPFSLLSLCPLKFHCLRLIVFSSSFFILTSSNTSSFDIFSIHDILVTLLQNHISTASSLLHGLTYCPWLTFVQ